jgi:hypothetical protein
MSAQKSSSLSYLYEFYFEKLRPPPILSYNSRSLSYFALFCLSPKISIASFIFFINFEDLAIYSSLSEFLSGCHFNAATLYAFLISYSSAFLEIFKILYKSLRGFFLYNLSASSILIFKEISTGNSDKSLA